MAHPSRAAASLVLCLFALAVAPMAAAAQITATAQSADGSAVAGVYLAAAADDQPWVKPAHETVAPTGVATWQVPAGSWRIIAIAPGFETAMSDAFTLSESDERQVRIALQPLTRVSGFVTDANGHPVAGASVTRSGTDGPLSVLGARHQQANVTATTSAKGAFTALVPAEGAHVLTVEARGYAPAVIDAARLAAPPGNVVVLAPGASLRASWSADPGERASKVTLLPIDAALPSGVTRERAAALWTRSLAEARWDSLPVGTYQLVLRAGSAAEDERAPTALAEIVLAPGDDRTVRLRLPEAEPATAAPEGVVRLLVAGAAPGDQLRVSRWADGSSTELKAGAQSVAGGVLLEARTRCGAGTVFVIESKTAIGSAVAPEACDATQRVSLAPRATLAAQVTASRGATPPHRGSLRLSSCPGQAGPVDIPFVVRGSRLEAAAIAGCAAASLRFPGFVPLAVQGATPAAGETRNLGSLALMEGAAAALRVRSARDAEPQSGVRVTAVRARDLAAARGDLELDRIALASVTTDAAGWGRISGLPEEHVVFVAQATGRAYPQMSEPYELPAGEETLIDDLLLEVPSSVLVTVSMPKALQDAVELDRVELYATGHSHWPASVPLRGTLVGTGAVVEDVPPGTWRVHTAGRLRNGFVIRAAETTVEVLPGVDAAVALNISDRLYQGRVTRGGAAVTGVLNLKPDDRTGGRRAAVAPVAADGTFQVLLESDGLYSVRFQESTGGGVMLDRWIAFEDPGKEIVIELPDGRITGRVVDSTGRPVPNVLVSGTQQITTPTGGIFARNTADGRFVLENVSSGKWELVAESDAGRSEPLAVAFDEGQLDDVTLLLEPTSTIRVRTTDATGGPLPGAFVTAEFPGPRGPRDDLRTTDADGLATFRVTRAEQATPLNLAIITPDMRLSCALRRLDTDQTVVVPQETGEVRLIGREWRAREGVRHWLVSSSGCAVPFMATRDEREPDGERAKVFPRLAAGTWSVVETHGPEQHAAVMTGRAARLLPIKTFTVQPGRTARVRLSGGSER